VSTFYKLTVRRIERDPDYDKKYAEWAKTSGPFNYDRSGAPQRDVMTAEALDVEITADEFKHLRDTVLGMWQ
jgi:hypothetical protein